MSAKTFSRDFAAGKVEHLRRMKHAAGFDLAVTQLVSMRVL